MPEASIQQLPLPDILMAVKHQVLEPWATQPSLEAQQQKDALLCLHALPAAESEARSEADESLAAEQTMTSVRKPPVSERTAGSTVHSPDAIQLRMLDSIQLGQMHSTADLASSEASPEAEQKANESSPEPAAAHALLSKDLSSVLDSSDVIATQVEADIAAAEEEEAAKEPEADLAAAEEAAEEAEATVLRLPSDVVIAAAVGDSPAADSEASSGDSFDEQQQQQPDWNRQWAQMQCKQQHQQQHASARRKQLQPSKLMKALAAAAVAEQSEPISAIFQRHSQLAEPCALPAAATYMVSRADAGLGASSTCGRQHVGRPSGAELLSENSSMAEDAGALLHYAQVSGHVLGGDQPALADAQHAEQAQHAQHRQSEDSSAASKRSLVPAVRTHPHDSSAETSPEAAKNSRMKMRRTSGEFQQVMLPCMVWLRGVAPTKQTAHGSCFLPCLHLLIAKSCHDL